MQQIVVEWVHHKPKGAVKMKLEMDKIIFESRSEIDEVQNGVDVFLKEHPKAEGADTLKQLSKLLDAMYMSW